MTTTTPPFPLPPLPPLIDIEYLKVADLGDLASLIERFRYDLLCSEAIELLPPFEEQHALKMLSYLELAQREATMGSYHQRQNRVRGTRLFGENP